MTDGGIEFKPNEDISGIEIELTTKMSEVSGLVTNSRGEAAKDYTVVVFAREQERWTGSTRYVATGRPDQDGRFKIRGLPPAQNYSIALDYVEPGFSLGDGEIRTVDLKLNSST